ncbi:hypothetical protein SUNI508_03774 [Seiridium unicorne]|uniref:Uncharacterized protein n=1 Tax=Seiridium unicorne TaxID=138068 RepID=A0ABR2VA15_9PEZI
MAASAVILGLLPTILQSLGSTIAETSLLELRRPGLAFLLAAGSPAVAFMKTGEFVETITKFFESAAETNTIACKAVLRFELAGMRDAMKYHDQNGRRDDEVELTVPARHVGYRGVRSGTVVDQPHA